MSALFNVQFQQFWAQLNSCPYDLPTELEAITKTALIKVGLTGTIVASENTNMSAENATTGKSGKKLSGYNVFMREQMALLKEQGVPGNERMVKIGAMWKGLSDEDKGIWNGKAVQQGGVAGQTAIAKVKASGVKQMTGYQFYVQEQMKIVKLDTAVPPKERMAKIGATWKVLDKNAKDAYTVKAHAK